MTRILWIRFFGGSLHTNSQNRWKNGHPFCLCLWFESWDVKSLLQPSSNVAAPVVRRRSGRVTRSTWWWRRSAATWSPSCSSSSTGESSEAEWQDRPMIESWSKERINLSNFVQYKSLKRRILLLWLVRKKNWTNFAVDFSAQYSNAQYLMDFATLFISSMNHNASSATFPCGSSVKDQRRKMMPSIPLWIVSNSQSLYCM